MVRTLQSGYQVLFNDYEHSFPKQTAVHYIPLARVYYYTSFSAVFGSLHHMIFPAFVDFASRIYRNSRLFARIVLQVGRRLD